MLELKEHRTLREPGRLHIPSIEIVRILATVSVIVYLKYSAQLETLVGIVGHCRKRTEIQSRFDDFALLVVLYRLFFLFRGNCSHTQ